jgi:hypothetical protein
MRTHDASRITPLRRRASAADFVETAPAFFVPPSRRKYRMPYVRPNLIALFIVVVVLCAIAHSCT